MFGDLNQAELLGNITNDINVRYTPNGRAVLSFGLATNRRVKNQNSEEWKDETTFHNVVVWGSDAEGLGQRAKKGTRIYVQGRLQTSTWDDKEGKKNYKTEIVAEKVILIDRFERGQLGSAGNAGGSSSAPSYKPQSKSNNSKSEAPSMPQDDIVDNNEINPDDLPF
jgi:single-strand DNA-binding protein